MPYELVSQNGRYCVRKQGASENLKCYDDKGKATAYLRALYANVHESVEGASLSFHITKAVVRDGKMVIKMTSSDTGKDLYNEAMSKELFDDFIAHINAGDTVPEPFASVILENESWTGGMPYVSLAHYKSGEGMKNVPGEVIQIGRDGNVLKATAVLHDTPLGRAVFKSLQKDLVEKRDDKIRVSIGFLDLEHSHGEKFTFTRKSLTDKCRLCKEGVGDKIYKKGHLVHLALTRVPANPRTDVEVERSMTTKREDAESIVDDEEVIKGLDLKSQADEVLVVKSEDNDEDEMGKDGKKKGKKDMPKEECSVVEPVVENSEFSQATPEVIASSTDPRGYVEVVDPSPVEKSIVALREKVLTIKSQGLIGDAALKELQNEYTAIGETLKAEFTPPPSPEEIAKQTLESTLRSLLGEMLPQALAQTVAPIQSQLDTLQSELREKSFSTPALPAQPKQEEKVVTVQRSIQPPTLAQKAIIEKNAPKVSQFDLIARQSVGLTQ